jgi:peptide/nickel transport system permease protein
MFFFVLRRLLISIPILLASSVLMFFLVTISGDPLADLRQSTNPNRDQIIAARRVRLRLNDPVWERYIDWLQGLARGDFGLNREGQEVSALLGQALGTTFRLIILATMFSILLGLVIGIITAVRQYSALDYTSTFAAFLFFSLPVFWLAVMLKEFGAIKLNNYLEEPGFSVVGIIVLAVVAGVIAGGLVGGSRPRRLAALGAVAVVIGALLVALDAADWMSNPGLSLPVVVVLSIAAGVLAAIIYAPSNNRPVMLAGVAGAVAAVVATLLFDGWITDMTWFRLLLSIIGTLALGAAVGAAVGGEIDRRAAIRAGMTAAFLVGVLVGFDRFISAWEPGRTIATIGPKTPNLDAPFWETMVDYAGHQVLPSLALALIGFATFMRFTRSSMLDTLKSDYVRTAKAKGLPATQVVMRHAFRTALIPVMTVVTISFATIIEGAVITERVFAWKGMGSLFVEGLQNVDPYPVMGFLVVVSVSIVLLNAVADIMYAYLDPRIRR